MKDSSRRFLSKNEQGTSSIVLVVFAIFLALFLSSIMFPSNPAFPQIEPFLTASAESESSDPPIIHSVLVDGKDSGNLHPLPYQTVNVSALVTRGENANVTLMRDSHEVIAPIAMHRNGNTYWYEVVIPANLSDLETYEFLVRCSNPNGSDSLRCGRAIRTNHLRVDAVLDPGTISRKFNITVTVRTWLDEPVTSGRVSVSMTGYRDEDSFTTEDLGHHQILNTGPTKINVERTFGNLTLLKFDIDTVDDDRNFLGRSSAYALGVPFPVNLSCSRELLDIRGFAMCGPFSPVETVQLSLDTLSNIPNATLLIYRLDQLQDLVLDGDEPISSQLVELVNGSSQVNVSAPEKAGSYLMAARSEWNGTVSVGLFSFVVQEFTMSVGHQAEVNRTEVLSMTIIPDSIVPHGIMSITILGPSALVLVSDATAIPADDSFLYDVEVPVFASNGTYHVLASYHGNGVFETYSVAVTNVTILGGPVVPPQIQPDPFVNPDPDDDVPIFWMILILGLAIASGIAVRSYMKWQKGSSSLDLHEVHGGITKDPEEEPGNREHTYANRKYDKTNDESGSGEKVELGKGEGEEGEGTSVQGQNDQISEENA